MNETNKIENNIKDSYIKMYLEKATPKQLKCINMLIENGYYKQVVSIIEEYMDEYLKKYNTEKDYKGYDGGSGSPNGGGMIRLPFEEVKNKTEKEDYSTEDMDPQTFEFYCILRLIDRFVNEKDERRRKMLDDEIEEALTRYREPEEDTPVRSR